MARTPIQSLPGVYLAASKLKAGYISVPGPSLLRPMTPVPFLVKSAPQGLSATASQAAEQGGIFPAAGKMAKEMIALGREAPHSRAAQAGAEAGKGLVGEAAQLRALMRQQASEIIQGKEEMIRRLGPTRAKEELRRFYKLLSENFFDKPSLQALAPLNEVKEKE
jgi:hypothetical protein